ncbi:MAG: hypothetical protein ACTSYE_01055 [Alphaproteobacteria bacterium]
MRNNANRTYMLGLGTAMLVVTTGLVVLNVSAPGLCPQYPLVALPACVVLLGYFALMLAALFVADARRGRWLFYVPGVLAFATGVGFTLNEIAAAGTQCPQLFGIPLPLCFTVPPAMGLMLYWAWSGTKRAGNP